MGKLGIAILALSCFALGWLFATVKDLRPYDPFAVVTVKNLSGTHIDSLEIDHPYGRLVIPELGASEQRQLAFYVPGEGSYTISARFLDGTWVRGGVGYIESGYHGTDTIFSDRIESRNAATSKP